jgi:hypothetical protein
MNAEKTAGEKLLLEMRDSDLLHCKGRKQAEPEMAEGRWQMAKRFCGKSGTRWNASLPGKEVCMVSSSRARPLGRGRIRGY